ncbi:RCC1 domain-containing protein RUG3, mitochondrial-like isoform X2 [Mastacembelus armatus]|uniref:RCC1 domain-containing protein RUG3, mitochondrial-like isoform X2 n=1 Tax=Mastacembelus armatus TaxID=205130 RepID=UPI000E464C96|nr:RCC1 domain-containing protein RUG3, mitochondrial-like isoform X2 [Mastacembelus armatus]
MEKLHLRSTSGLLLYSELDMDLLCWGSGELGQTGCGRLGDIGPEESHMRGFTVARLGTVKLLACGSSHSIVVTVDNKIFAWGNGTSGQLGDGERALKDQPVEVKLPQELAAKRNEADVNLVNIVGVACGSRHSFIWTETGQAYSFGNNFYAQLGYDFQRADFKEHQLAPCLFRNLPSSLKISQVACGERHTLFALEDGSVAACGQNDYGQIGSGSDENAVVPRFVECVGQVSKVTCGANHNLVLTAGGRLFQWGCGRACGNIKKNILFPEEVTLPNMPVRDIAGGCWHSLLLTDGGNVFSWGMGQEGQLGLGEDRIHISTPCLLSYSQLTKVTQIQAGDSYSAAVTGGELFLWGQIPCVSRVSDHPGLRRLWTPQPVPLADRKVCDVATGTWHIMVLAKRSREKNEECVHPETEACFRDAVSNPPPTEKEKENTVQDLQQVQHKLLQGEDGRVGFKEQENDQQSESAEEEERHERSPNKDEGDGASQSSTFAIARSATKMDWRGNSQSSIKSDQRDEREGCRTVRPWEVRKEVCRGRDVVFTTLHLLPRPKGEQCGHTASTLPPLLTGQQSHSRVLAEARKERSTHLTDLVQKSGSDRIIVQDSKLRPKPPGKYTGLGAQRAASCHHSRLHPDLKSPVHCSCPHPNPGQQVQFSSISTHLGSCETGLCPATSSSEPFRYCPTHRRVVSSQGTSSKDL